MTDEQEEQKTNENEPRDESRDSTENNRPDDTLASEKKCPECGEPVDDVRATCINCGYEYKEEDHEDLEAGSEFVTGSQIDEEGNELPDEEPPAQAEEATDEEKD